MAAAFASSGLLEQFRSAEDAARRDAGGGAPAAATRPRPRVPRRRGRDAARPKRPMPRPSRRRPSRPPPRVAEAEPANRGAGRGAAAPRRRGRRSGERRGGARPERPRAGPSRSAKAASPMPAGPPAGIREEATRGSPRGHGRNIERIRTVQRIWYRTPSREGAKRGGAWCRTLRSRATQRKAGDPWTDSTSSPIERGRS